MLWHFDKAHNIKKINMKTKEELAIEIQNEIDKINKRIGGTWSNDVSDATNRVAISNLYIALSNLTK